jgi:hypothetical protein
MRRVRACMSVVVVVAAVLLEPVPAARALTCGGSGGRSRPCPTQPLVGFVTDRSRTPRCTCGRSIPLKP